MLFWTRHLTFPPPLDTCSYLTKSLAVPLTPPLLFRPCQKFCSFFCPFLAIKFQFFAHFWHNLGSKALKQAYFCKFDFLAYLLGKCLFWSIGTIISGLVSNPRAQSNILRLVLGHSKMSPPLTNFSSRWRDGFATSKVRLG